MLINVFYEEFKMVLITSLYSIYFKFYDIILEVCVPCVCGKWSHDFYSDVCNSNKASSLLYPSSRMFWSLIGQKCIMWLRIIPLESLYYVIFSPRPNSKIPKPKIRADKPTATAAHCCTLQLQGPERPPQYTTCMHTALRCIHCAIERLQQQWLPQWFRGGKFKSTNSYGKVWCRYSWRRSVFIGSIDDDTDNSKKEVKYWSPFQELCLIFKFVRLTSRPRSLNLRSPHHTKIIPIDIDKRSITR